MKQTLKDLMKYTLGLILLTPLLALEIILNDTKMSISELNRLDTVSKRSKKDRLINKLNETKKTFWIFVYNNTLYMCTAQTQTAWRQYNNLTIWIVYMSCLDISHLCIRLRLTRGTNNKNYTKKILKQSFFSELINEGFQKMPY